MGKKKATQLYTSEQLKLWREITEKLQNKGFSSISDWARARGFKHSATQLAISKAVKGLSFQRRGIGYLLIEQLEKETELTGLLKFKPEIRERKAK